MWICNMSSKMFVPHWDWDNVTYNELWIIIYSCYFAFFTFAEYFGSFTTAWSTEGRAESRYASHA